MLTLPGKLTSERFLAEYWQKKPLFMATAMNESWPSMSRNELAWLATLQDVESRIVFIEHISGATRYRAKTGPFDVSYLETLPKRDWTLLVHDVEKHLPAMRELFKQVPFIPDWRIDDLMVSFAAPGGGVGPHRDNYDVFLCQGIGARQWRFTTAKVSANEAASSDLALLSEFDEDQTHSTHRGDVLYLPPGVAHWGIAERACMTYSIGMRAPQASDLVDLCARDRDDNEAFYGDADLMLEEARPGYISRDSGARVAKLLRRPEDTAMQRALGRFATRTKRWLAPDCVAGNHVDDFVDAALSAGTVSVHGMARIAFDDAAVYVNGVSRALSAELSPVVARLCEQRKLGKAALKRLARSSDSVLLLKWMAQYGAFDPPNAFNH